MVAVDDDPAAGPLRPDGESAVARLDALDPLLLDRRKLLPDRLHERLQLGLRDRMIAHQVLKVRAPADDLPHPQARQHAKASREAPGSSLRRKAPHTAVAAIRTSRPAPPPPKIRHRVVTTDDVSRIQVVTPVTP